MLDVGCAVGGLGRALAEVNLAERYTGIDINEQAIELARKDPESKSLSPEFYLGDVVTHPDLENRQFDTVVSLGCADWNVDVESIINKCWDLVAPKGRFIVSLRLTPGETLRDFNNSYQYVSFDTEPGPDAEKAPYVVFNVAEAIGLLGRRTPTPSSILGYGYWGPVSVQAHTFYKDVVFAVFALEKGAAESEACTIDLRLPIDAWPKPAS